MTAHYNAAVLAQAEPDQSMARLAVYIYGPKRTRQQSAEFARDVSPHLPIIHVWWPWIRLVIREHLRYMVQASFGRLELSVIGACAFLLGAVVIASARP